MLSVGKQAQEQSLSLLLVFGYNLDAVFHLHYKSGKRRARKSVKFPNSLFLFNTQFIKEPSSVVERGMIFHAVVRCRDKRISFGFIESFTYVPFY